MSDSQCVSERPRSTPFSEYVQRQRNLANAPKIEAPGGRKLWRQMVTGFICAACLGFIMLLLGSIFIGQAIQGENSITIMLCVMGMGKFCYLFEPHHVKFCFPNELVWLQKKARSLKF